MPCHVPTCPTRPGPSGFCALHQNRINARANGNAKHMTDADRVAIAAHPGWRGRKWRLVPFMWPAGLYFHVDPPGGMGEDFRTAAEALAELDRKNGVAPADRLARLEADLDVDRRDNRDMWCALDAIQGITVGRFPPPATSTDKPPTGAVAVEKVAALKRRLDEAEADATKLTAERRSAMRALNDIRAIARGLLPAPLPPSTSPATLEESALATVATLIRDRDEIRRDRDTLAADLDAIRTHRDALEERRRELATDNDVLSTEIHLLRFANAYMRNSVETYHKRLEVYSAALDRQATDIARLTSELAERERDITYACADRDEYLKERDALRLSSAADADTIDNLRTGVGHLETALTLARRPWWRKVWAWVTGGGK